MAKNISSKKFSKGKQNLKKHERKAISKDQRRKSKTEDRYER